MEHGSGRFGAARKNNFFSRASSARRALFGVALGLALLSFSGASSVGAQDASGDTLQTAVTAELSELTGKTLSGDERGVATTGEPGAQVNVMREGEGWAFGSAVVEAPKKRGHYPSGWLFVARESEEGWSAELEGAGEFPELIREAPESLVGEEEKALLTDEARYEEPGARSTAATSVERTGLMLPWKKGTRWQFTGGPHGWATGYDRPYAALDFVGRYGVDQSVRAAGGGYIYNMCSSGKGWIRIYHPNGYSTDYYHLRKNIKPRSGQKIRRGTVIGQTGQDVSCGGASYGRHVHFALLKGEQHVKVGGKRIGGWVFRQSDAYYGRAERGSTVKRPGGGTLLKNFG